MRQMTAIIERKDLGYVALCPELDIASQGETVESARQNLIEALELFFEAADQSEVERPPTGRSIHHASRSRRWVSARVLSGDDVCRILHREGFVEVRGRGSHVVMQKRSAETTITVPVPVHNQLKAGTLGSIIRQSGCQRRCSARTISRSRSAHLTVMEAFAVRPLPSFTERR